MRLAFRVVDGFRPVREKGRADFAPGVGRDGSEYRVKNI